MRSADLSDPWTHLTRGDRPESGYKNALVAVDRYGLPFDRSIGKIFQYVDLAGSAQLILPTSPAHHGHCKGMSMPLSRGRSDSDRAVAMIF